MEHLNSFIGGMNKDLSKVLLKPDAYLHAENLSLITQLGQSTGILRNIKGNDLFFEIPYCSNVVEITSGGNGLGSVTLQFGNTYNIDFSDSNWPRILAESINNDPLSFAVGAAYTSTHVVVWSLLDSSNNLIRNNVVFTSGGDAVVNNAYVPGITIEKPKILGWGTIRDTVILYTSTETSTAPTGAYGQIWKFEYDKVFLTPVLTLLYHNQINLSLGNPIANPGRFVGNYETPAIQKIYWTDNYNSPRYLNIADPNAFAIQPQNLDSMPNIVYGNGVIQEIIQTGGVLPVGTYQVSYRLKKTGGGKTSFFILDNPLPITTYNDTVDGLLLTQGAVINSTTLTSKQLAYTFYDLDTNFQNIEVAIIYRAGANASPEINIIADEPIPPNGQFNITISGNETVITTLTVEEFISEPLNFETVKTIASKNNYLFYGNVKYSDFDVDFDARAYRFDSTQNTYLTIDTNIPDTWGVPLENDAINPNQDPNDSTSYVYQIDGTTIGGSGPRVSYKFNTPDITSDYKVILDNTIVTNAINTSRNARYNTVRTSFNIDLGNDTEPYNNRPVVSTFADFRSPYIQAALKGYLRDEVYAFGIVFYSKKGETSYVHWIGDIRIPHVYMRYNLTYPTAIRDSGTLYGFPMGIEFTVDVTGLEDLIDGYSIVRCERADRDKTILGQGLMLNATYIGGSGVQLLSNGMNIDTSGGWDVDPYTGSFYSPDFNFLNFPQFKSGDLLNFVGLLGVNQILIPTDSGGEVATNSFPDAFLYTKIIKNYEFVPTPNPVLDQQLNYPLLNAEGLDAATVRGTNGVINLPNYTSPLFPPFPVVNISPVSGPSLRGRNRSMNNKLLVFRADNPFTNFSNYNADWARLDEVENGDSSLQNNSKCRAYLMNYKTVLGDQYGGNTYSARSSREYISTGHIRKIRGSSINTDTVFGGDTYVCLYDTVTHFPNRYDSSFIDGAGTDVFIDYAIWDDITNAPAPFASAEDWGYWQARIIPVETSININWRRNPTISVVNMDTLYGAYPTPNAGGVPGTPGDRRLDTYEDFTLETGYYLENNVVKYFPKPIGIPANDKFDVRVFRSSPKINGELIESWGIFQEENYLDLDSAQGELNNLIVHQDRLLGFQDRGISQISVNERSLTQDSTGAELVLGTGGVLARYDYISKQIGSRHQFGFTQSHDAVFFFDINTKNIYKLDGVSPVALTVIKGMQSFTTNNLNGLIQVNDNPYLNKGITSTYDFRYNEAIFSFRDLTADNETRFIYAGLSFGPNSYIFNSTVALPAWVVIGQEVLVTYTALSGSRFSELGVITNVVAPSIEVTLATSNPLMLPITAPADISQIIKFNFTLAFNDFIGAFTSFYSFSPPVFVNDRRNIFSTISGTDLWIHDKGPYVSFYDTIYPSKLSLLINPYPTETKVFDNYEITTESINVFNQNVPDDTFNTIRVYNDYQNSDFRDILDVAKRKERTWNITNLRNRVLYTTNPTDIFTDLAITDIPFSERMRDKYLTMDLSYNNLSNNKLQLHTVKTHFRRSAR